MLMTFITTLKVLVRDRNVLIWSMVFPLVLTTLFYFMFSSLDESYQLDPIAVVVVEDAHYEKAENFDALIESLAANDANNGSPLIIPTFVANEDAAREELKSGFYYGYITIDDEGSPTYHRDTRRSEGSDPSQSIIAGVLDRYVQNTSLITRLVTENPTLLADPDFLESLTKNADASFTEQISITQNPPSDSQRYYYAVLAFSVIMMATIALVAIDMVLANTSPLGARRSLGGQSKLRMLVPTLSAAWLLGFLCVLIGFLYLRFVLNVDFGDKDAFVVLTLLVSSLTSTFFGAFIGSLPFPSGGKSGLVSFFSCFLSLLAGLYGPFSQDLGDLVAERVPLLSAANPVRQVSDALFALYYYDGYEQLTQHIVALLVIGAVFFVAVTLMLRRKRYASL